MNSRDAYATLASVALGFPYEECLEFNPITHELNPEGKARRSVGKVLNLGEPSRLNTLPVTMKCYAPLVEAL